MRPRAEIVVKISCLIISIMFIFLAVPTQAFAAAEQKAKITGDDVNFRQSASTSSKILAKLKKNTEVTVIKKTGNWYNVSYNDTEGYVIEDYVSLITEAASSSTALKKGYVNDDGVAVKSSAKMSSTTVTTLKLNKEIEIKSTTGEWYYITVDKKNVYILKEYVSSKKVAEVAEDDSTAEAKAAEANTTLKQGMSNTAVKNMQQALRKKGHFEGTPTGYYGTVTVTAVKSFQKAEKLTVNGIANPATLRKLYDVSENLADVTPTVTENKKTATVNGKVELVSWFSGGNELFKKYTVYEVTDVRTGIRYNIRRFGGWYHADVEPYTKEDTAKFLETAGGKWSAGQRRPIWVQIGDRYIAASIMCWPHGTQTILNNGMQGQVCIHLKDSKIHESNKVDANHQAAVQEAFNAGSKYIADPNGNGDSQPDAFKPDQTQIK